MLRKIRIGLASLVFIGITLLFLDFTGSLHAWLGWMAKIQFLPAVLALNFIIVGVLILLTLIFGRLYCSVICPMGILQDIMAWLSTKKHKNRYHYTKPKTALRIIVMAIFAILMLTGVHSLAILIAPYSAYGRIAQNLLSPIYLAGNNILAYFAERVGSYAFYATDIWIRSISTFLIAVITLAVIGVLAWRGGRTWCNTICPVGTILGLLSRYAWFRPVIDKSKCVGCKVCVKRCKASCIDGERHFIDMSRCVVCMNCIDNCKSGAIQYRHVPYKQLKSNDKTIDSNDNKIASNPPQNNEPSKASEIQENISSARRGFLMALPTLAISSVAAAADNKTTDGGMAELKPRQIPNRQTPIKPPGGLSLSNFSKRCTGCQLCVSSCPNHVLRPSASLPTLMQPEMSYENGYCRPECTKCSQVCPAGAIQPILREDKISTQIGIAVWSRELCLPANGIDKCGNCARHCPNGAIKMIEMDGKDGNKVQIPAIHTERCIGCGACEYVCPVRPISAIHVEGCESHRTL